VSDDTLILGLLNTLEREVLPAIEGGDVQAWGKANRIADAVLALIPDSDRASIELPPRSADPQPVRRSMEESADGESSPLDVPAFLRRT
jgi:hypothetical protein